MKKSSLKQQLKVYDIQGAHYTKNNILNITVAMSSIYIKERKRKPFFVVITGPTGVGKTALVEELARVSSYTIAIINGDMGQLYTPLSIGTAKPQLAQQTVAHYLFNILDKPCSFTVHDYRTHVQVYLEKLWNIDTVPIIVGGSGFYIKSLFFALRSYTQDTDNNNIYTLFTTVELWHKLNIIDPQRAANINIHDRYRIIRALTLYNQTGLLPSALAPVYAPVGRALIVYITREKQELSQYIEHRIDQMFAAGWIDEVRNLSPVWREFVKQKKIIGYPEISNYLDRLDERQTCPEQLTELKSSIAQQTKAYAKRQQTFWRSFKRELNAVSTINTASNGNNRPEIQEINLTFTDLALYTKQLEQVIYTLQST